MKISKAWLKDLVNVKVPIKEVERLLPLRTIAIKEITDNHIELDMKGYNRADLLSMRGVAREVAAITDSELKFSESLGDSESLERLNVSSIKVSVENEILCPVYCIAKIEGLKVEQSNPDWVKKMEDSGIRSINNVADVTNLIMLEYGQPMHAFDSDKIGVDARAVKDESIIVRNAKESEKITTLDGKTRDLNENDLLITNPQNVLGIAGVMGGKDSEISDTTMSILLEAAIFDPVSIRRTSQRHGLHSEASKRFQHGLTKTNLLQAFSTAIKLYEGLGGKLTAITLTGKLGDEPITIQLSQKKINDLIGIEIPQDQVESSLKKLGFTLASQGQAWEVRVPYWRLDINIEEDLVEEVARMYGYERIPAKELEGEIPEKIDQNLFELIYKLKSTLADIGLTEVQTYSFYSSQTISTFHFPLSTLIRVANPISSETEYLRDQIWPNLIEVVAKNIKQGFKDIAIFEVGKVYSYSPTSLRAKRSNLPKETYHLAIALMNETDNPIQELSVILNEMKKINISFADAQDDIDISLLFHPTRFAKVKSGDKIIGSIAEVHPRILNKFGIEKRVAILEIEVEPLIDKLV